MLDVGALPVFIIPFLIYVLIVLFLFFQLLFLFIPQTTSTEPQSMPDGEVSGGADRLMDDATTFCTTNTSPPVERSLGVSGVDEDGLEPGSIAQGTGKDPREIARRYVISIYIVRF